MLFIFAGTNYYPSGGANDCIGCTTSMEEALERVAQTDCDWWHIANEGMQIVKSGRKD